MNRRLLAPVRQATLRSSSPIVVCTVLALTLPACGGEMRDDADAGDTSAVSQSTVSVGGAESGPGTEFDGIIGALRLQDGRLVVADRGLRLIFLDGQGRHLRTVGRQGYGPGEFQSISYLQRLSGDSLFVYDWSQSRGSVFSPDGEFVRSIPNPISGSLTMALLSDGTAISEDPVPSGVGGPVPLIRPGTELVRSDAGGRVLNTVALVPGDELFRVESAGNLMVMGAEIFLRTIVLAGGEEVYVATGDRFEVTVFDANGGLLRQIQRDPEPQRIMPADAVRYFARAPTFPPTRESDFELFSGGRSAPAIVGLLLDDLGHLWVEEFSYQRTSAGEMDWSIRQRSYSVFDTTGEWVGSVQMPDAFRPTHIGIDFVVGVWQDSLDVEHLQLRRLDRTRLLVEAPQ